MKILMIFLFAHVVLSQSSHDRKEESSSMTAANLRKLQQLLQDRLRTAGSSPNLENQTNKMKDGEEVKNFNRKSKSLAFYPFFPPTLVPYGSRPVNFYSQNKEIVENSYPGEWLSRTEPFKKNPPLLDSPTYYIRLPPNPYVFVPGIGYVSRPPSLSEPEVLENNKPDQTVGNDILHDPFYRLPINFMSNGKPTSVYQLPNGHPVPKPESSLINLNKGPYVFNGKPSEIFLVAQIFDALYGDELTHFYP